MIKNFDAWHLLWVGSSVVGFLCLSVALWAFFRYSYIFTKIFIFSILAVNAGLFAMAFDFADITIDLLLVNVIAFPIIFLCGGRILKDYMFYIGIISAVYALIWPMPILGESPYGFECMRYFTMYAGIMFAPIMMVLCGHHVIYWRRFWVAPIVLAIAIGLTDIDIYAEYVRVGVALAVALGGAFALSIVFDFRRVRRDFGFVFYTLVGKLEKRNEIVGQFKLSRLKTR